MPNLGLSELIVFVLALAVPLWALWAARGFLKGLIRGLSGKERYRDPDNP
jgi:hypothetical protein